MSSKATQVESFWVRQFSQIKNEGWLAVRRKAWFAAKISVKLLVDLVGYILAVPVVLFVRLIRPFKLVRFGYFLAGRIGSKKLSSIRMLLLIVS